MHYSRNELETIGEAALADFRRFLCRKTDGTIGGLFFPVPIDTFAALYLSLDVRYAPLSRSGDVWGLTAYADTVYIPEGCTEERALELRAGDVLLDDSFQDPCREKPLSDRRRFTLAHECAHQLLYRMEPDEQQHACRRMYSERRAYTFRELKTKEDWNERQANALAAALLMPASIVSFVMNQLSPRHRIPCFGGLFTPQCQEVIDRFRSIFGVSRSAAEIRLRQMDYLEDFSPEAFLDADCSTDREIYGYAE